MSMNKFEITFDEQYQLIKLYDLLRDTGMTEELPNEITTFFEKLMDKVLCKWKITSLHMQMRRDIALVSVKHLSEYKKYLTNLSLNMLHTKNTSMHLQITLMVINYGTK